MGNPIDKPMLNHRARQVRGFLLVAGLFASISISCVGAAMYSRRIEGNTDPHGQDIWWIVTIISGIFAFTMVICSLGTISASRAVNRAIAAMRSGDYLLHWSYPPETWLEFDRVRAKGVWFNALVAVGCIMGAGVLIAVVLSLADDIKDRWTVIAILFSMFVGVSIVVFGFFAAYQSHRRRRGRKYPDTIITHDALYYGGETLTWGSAGMRLVALHFNPAKKEGELANIELEIGASEMLEKFTTAAKIVALAAGRPGEISSLKILRKIPVPPGKESEAQQVCAQLIV